MTGDVEPACEDAAVSAIVLATEIQDDLLRMLFLCADPEIPHSSRLALALKTLCGFSTEEIARRLFQTNEGIHKRLQRARARLNERRTDLEMPSVRELEERVPSILEMLYLLFNEGYSSTTPDTLIRRELCDEALRLSHVLVDHPIGAVPEADALLALMYFHASRLDARVDSVGGLLLLKEQDRSLWNRSLIGAGVSFLRRAARGNTFSRYHIEAAIAVEHCLASSYAETPWAEIVRLYSALDRVAPSPLHRLNRAIAIAEWQGAEAAITALEGDEPPPWLLDYYLWDATWSELHRRAGNPTRALTHLLRAIDAAPTLAEKSLLERRKRELERSG